MGQPEEDFAPSDHLDPEERDPEAEPADAVEQATQATQAGAADVDADAEPRRGLEVDDWDAIEQARVITADEDDYR